MAFFMVKLYEVGVIYKEDNDTHRETELLVFNDETEAEDYIRKGAVKALFTLAPIEKINVVAKKFFQKTAEDITSELIDGLSKENAIKIYDVLKKLCENPTVDKYFVEEVPYLDGPNGEKYPVSFGEKLK